MGQFTDELKRRNVFRVGIAYLVAAWLVIQIVETIFPAFGFGDAGVRTVVIVLAIGIIPVLIFSWLYELTPDGLKLERDVDRSRSIVQHNVKKLDRAIIVVLTLAVGFFAVDKFVLDPARDAELQVRAVQQGRSEALVESYGDKSIAVLPFIDLSPGKDQAYFSDGLAEEVLNLLAQIRELRVISRSSAFQFRGDVHIPEVAEQLNVSYVLEGSVRKAGQQIRVTVQLIDARSDSHVWSKNYDRALVDIFAIQDDIAQSIVDELHILLTGARPQSVPTDPETYALYLQARHLVSAEQSPGDLPESLLLQALKRDPDYVPALNLIVRAILSVTGHEDYDKYTQEEGIPLMRSYVDRVLAIDAENSHAIADRGWMAFFYNNDLETAASYIEGALSLDPANSWALHIAGVISRTIGHNDDAIAFAEMALARDPLCSVCLYALMTASFRSGQLDKALAASERRMRVALGGWFTQGNIYLFKGDVQKALQLYENQKDNRIAWLSSRAIAFHELEDEEARDAALAELMKIDSRQAVSDVAKVYAWMGNIDEAFKWLDSYLEPQSPAFTANFTPILWDPFFRNLWDDPRWAALRLQADLTPERLDNVRIGMP
ncbi:MAG: hypothetical protein IIA07_10765 [Proteobacteria bacterium]|nr:hypothetical protein [Pseudomonadota bacterium]